MESLWHDQVKLPQFPQLEQDISTEVLIIGGGLAGILCARFLQQAGVDYVLVEAGHICGGVTGNTTAKITSQHGFIYQKLLREFGAEKARQYYRANEEALAAYRGLCRDLDCDFEEKDSYVYSLKNRIKLEREWAALKQIGIRAELTEPATLPFPTVGAIRFPDQAQFHPLKFIKSIADGLKIYEQSPVLAFDGDGYRTSQGIIRPKKTIVATHFPIWNKHGAYFLKLYQHRSYVLALEHGPQMDGMYVDESGTGLSFRNQGDLLLLGGGSHHTGKPGGGWEELEQCARIYYPGASVRYRWATQDCMSLDGMPYIGRYGRHTDQLFVATGFNKWGMTSSMVAAQLLRDLVTEKENTYESIFSPSRSMLRPQLAANGFQAIWNLLTPTVPRCPHMGCALKWNAQEHCWECPCHGSRFSQEGKLLHGPSTGSFSSEKN